MEKQWSAPDRNQWATRLAQFGEFDILKAQITALGNTVNCSAKGKIYLQRTNLSLETTHVTGQLPKVPLDPAAAIMSPEALLGGGSTVAPSLQELASQNQFPDRMPSSSSGPLPPVPALSPEDLARRIVGNAVNDVEEEKIREHVIEIVFVLDTSGSMFEVGPQVWQTINQALAELLNYEPKEIRVGVVLLSDETNIRVLMEHEQPRGKTAGLFMAKNNFLKNLVNVSSTGHFD